MFDQHLAGFNLREVEDVVDGHHQGFGTFLDDAGKLLLFGRKSGVEQEIGHADNAIHRGADFMAHIRQKVTLGLIGGCGTLDTFKPCLIGAVVGDSQCKQVANLA